MLQRPTHVGGEALRRSVDQRVDGACAEPVAGNGDEQRDADGGERVGPRQPGPRRHQPDEHEAGADEIARVMQGVGGDRVAAGLLATRRKARQRRMSTTIEISTAAKAKPPATTSPCSPSRRTASAATPTKAR